MKRLLVLLVIPLLCLGAAAPSASRFTPVDVMIDPKGQPLAAWQLEFAAETGDISLVGVEAGEHPAYAKRPPYYDPAALAGKRIVVGDYSLDPDLPKTKTRVVRLMLEVKGDANPQYVTKIMAAANADGKSIPVDVSLVAK
jgi:hypothetical protein